MDISNDFIRREAAASQIEHVSAMRQMRELVSRVFGAGGRPGAAKAELVTGLDRRGFLRVGGMTVASAAIFAACGDDDDESAAAPAGGDDDEKKMGAEGDITILRTASSLELLAVDVYQTAIDSGLVTTKAVADAAKLFQEQHREHAGLFTGATKQLGGEPFEEANPAVLQQLQPAIAALRDEAGVVKLAYDLENVAAATYFSTVGGFEDVSLNQAAMSVGGVEARHAAVLASVLNLPAAPKAFFTADGAVAAGTGV